MIITVIGHICKDVIHTTDKENSHKETFGGIIYSLLTLANLMSDKDTIQPVFGIGQADYDELIGMLNQFKNIDTKGIFKIKGPTNQVHLFYKKNLETRVECSKNISPPIPFNKIKPYLDCDGILINMVSGLDITLETLDYIRMEIREQKIPIHFDFHSLTLGIDQEFKRFRRPLTDWRRWCFLINSIQLSEEEAQGLTTEKYDEDMLVNHLMPLMVNVLLITRGSRGVTVIQQDNHKNLTRQDIEGVSFGATKDTTGCGDVFGAAFTYFFLKTKDSIQAAEMANKIAALKATVSGIDFFTDFWLRIEQKGVLNSKSTTNLRVMNNS